MSGFVTNLTFGHTQEAVTYVDVMQYTHADDKGWRMAGLLGKFQSPTTSVTWPLPTSSAIHPIIPAPRRRP